MNIKEIKNEDNAKKCYKISLIKANKLKKNLKATAIIMAGGIAVTSLIGCSSCNSKKTEVEVVSELLSEEEVESEEVVKDNEAAAQIYTLQDDAVIACNDALRVGIDLSYDHVVDQNDIDTYATQFTNYLIVTNMDNYNDKLFAEMMTESNVSADDLVDSFMNLNTAFKKHLITVTYDNLYDFNDLYNKEDAEILNHAQSLIATMNENGLESQERKEAAKEFYAYATDIINSTNARMALSPQALDTLVTFIEAYDELTFNYKSSKVKGAYVDDELEHALNISKESCFGVAADSKLEVQDHVVENFKSLFRTHILKDLNEKYVSAKEERSLQLQLGNTLNELNSYENIITYVKDHIKIDLYKAVETDYQTWLKSLKGLNGVGIGQKYTTGKVGQNSGTISDGKGGVISNQQLQQYGISTAGKTAEQVRKELEKAVKEEQQRKEEKEKVVTKTDQTGKASTEIQPISGTVEDAQNGYVAGYSDGQSNKYNCPSDASEAYKTAYNNGYTAGQSNAKEMQEKFSKEETKYEPVSDGDTKTEVTVKTEDYTTTETKKEETTTTTETKKEETTSETTPTITEPGEYFESIDEEIIEEEEIIETITYTSASALKEELISYKNLLMELTEKEDNLTSGYRI